MYDKKPSTRDVAKELVPIPIQVLTILVPYKWYCSVPSTVRVLPKYTLFIVLCWPYVVNCHYFSTIGTIEARWKVTEFSGRSLPNITPIEYRLV